MGRKYIKHFFHSNCRSSILDSNSIFLSLLIEVNLLHSECPVQNFMVQNVRRIQFEVISNFLEDFENEKDLVKLIEVDLAAISEAFQIPLLPVDSCSSKIGATLLNLYRTGRLGHYTLDRIPLPQQ